MMLAAAEVDACVYSAAGSSWMLALGCAVGFARRWGLGRRAMVINASPRAREAGGVVIGVCLVVDGVW